MTAAKNGGKWHRGVERGAEALDSTSSYLGCLALLIYVYGAFLALRVFYVVAVVYFAFVSCFFPPESLPSDDALYRLLPRPL